MEAPACERPAKRGRRSQSNMEPGAQKLYSRALDRLGAEAFSREQSRDIPYPLSLHALTKYFWRTGTKQGWLPDVPKEPLMLAVSGGGDSVALLWLFRRLYAGPLLVAHVNHGIRGAASAGDAAFVKNLAETWGLPFFERRAEVPAEREQGESLETAARRVRQRELISLAESGGAWGIATGHNRDDLAETALFNILRGTGPRGAVGIPEQRGLFFRPLLGLRRKFLRELLRVRGLSWREDETNNDTAFTRNFIRLELLPLIEERVNAGAVDHLADFAANLSLLREDEEQRGATLLEAALLDDNGGGLTLDRKKIAELSPLERALVIRAAGRRLGLPVLSRRRIEELSALIVREGPFNFQWMKWVNVVTRPGVIRWGHNPLRRTCENGAKIRA